MAAEARRVLVTGADGLVGSWLVAALLDRGDAVAVLRRGGSPGPQGGDDPRVTVAVGDLLDPSSVERALAGHDADTVVHLAAQSIVGLAHAEPVETFEVNVAGTWHLLEACRRHDVARVVVASSDKVYGTIGAQPPTEDAPLAARFPYDVSKACADLVARSFAHTYDLPVAVARLPNVYGPGDRNASRLVPELVGAIRAGRAPVIRSDGSPRRDFLFASDAAAAYLAICDAIDAGVGAGEAFNAGSGTSHSVREVVDALLELSHSDLRARYVGTGAPEGELPAGWVDSGKLRAATGWAPRVALRDGLAVTLEAAR